VSHETWLITGGAGYIGSHIADAFLDDGKDVIIYDSLYRGLESRIEYLRNKHKTEIPLIIADIRDIKAFNTALRNYKPDGVIHTAALKSVTESIKIPDEYFEVNFQATRKLLETISSHGIHKVIYSSTAAVYGAPDHGKPVEENEPKNPISPYGASKLAAEDLIVDFLEKKGNTGTSLRFFNVIGAASRELLDNSTENLVPIVIDKIRNNRAPEIFGTNYPTSDGTCVRDYVDVRDIASAHLAAANCKVGLPKAMNVGTGRSESVRRIIDLISSLLSHHDVTVIQAEPREGDPASLTADIRLIQNSIGFVAKFSIEESIESAI
jgi:UDP-glucose 4-epimerase